MNDNELREWAVTGRIDGETQEQAMQRLGREIAERLAENKRLLSEISLMKMQSATEALAWSLGQMWIAVGDRMPEAADGEYVLVTNAGVVGLATHRNGWRHAIGRYAWEPTHWMPLPEPPVADLRFALRQATDRASLAEVKCSQLLAAGRLTDAEREAVESTIVDLDGGANFNEQRFWPMLAKRLRERSATLRGLLERLG